MADYRADEREVLNEDLPALSAREHTFDWTVRLVLSAIRSLRAAGGR